MNDSLNNNEEQIISSLTTLTKNEPISVRTILRLSTSRNKKRRKREKAFKTSNDRKVLAISSKSNLITKSSKMKLSLKINDRTVRLLIDTGAEISIISSEIADELSLSRQKHKSGKLIFADQSSVPRGDFTLGEVSSHGRNFTFKFDIFNTNIEDVDGICGLDLLEALGATLSFPIFRENMPQDEADILFPNNKPHLVSEQDSIIKEELKVELECNANIKGTCNHPALPVTLPMRQDTAPAYTGEIKMNEINLLAIRNWLQESIDSGIIVASPLDKHDNEFNNPIFPVWPKDRAGVRIPDKKPRIVINPKYINELLITDRMPIPNIVILREQLMQYQYFAEIDLSKAFNQFPLHHDDQHKTTFTVEGTKYQFTVLQFGFANGTAIFQKIMCDIFKSFTNISIYVDNIIIGAHSLQQLKETVKQAILTLNKFNLRINIDKSTFCTKELNVLGATISHNKVTPTSKMMFEAANFDFPRSGKELHSILGFGGFFRPFILNYAEIVRPLEILNNLAKSISTTQFRKYAADPTVTKAFLEFKQALATPTTLNKPVDGHQLCLICDASDTAISGVIFQQIDSNLPTPENIIGIFTQNLNETQQKYNACKRELHAVVMSIRHFEYRLAGTEFLILTDSEALTYPNSPQNRISGQWFDYLLNFNYKIAHVSGLENFLADFLSRHSQSQPINDNSNINIIQEESFTPVNLSRSSQSYSINDNSNINIIQEERFIPLNLLYYVSDDANGNTYFRVSWEGYPEHDTSFEKLNTKLKDYFSPEQIQNVPSAQQYFDKHYYKTDFFYSNLQEETLEDPFNSPPVSFSYPDPISFSYDIAARARLIIQTHEKGHFDPSANMLSLKEAGFYWPSMFREIKAYVKTCKKCAEHNPIRRIFNSLHSVTTKHPWEHIQMDLCLCMEDSVDYKYFLLIVDVLTSFTFSFPLFTKDAEEIVPIILNLLLKTGIPQKSTTDGGGEFTNKLLKRVFELLRVDHHISIPYSFVGHGKVESSIKTISKIVKKMSNDDTTSWPLYLETATHHFNNKISPHTNLSPFQMFMARPFIHAGQMEKITPRDLELWIQIMQTHVKLINPKVAEVRKIKLETDNKNFIKKHRKQMVNDNTRFKVGDLVYILSTQRTKKSQRLCEGPFTIEEEFENNSFGLTQGAIKHSRRVPITELKHFSLAPHELNGETTIFKSILNHRGSKKRMEYLILWEDNTSSWENADIINDKTTITNYHVGNLPENVKKTKHSA